MRHSEEEKGIYYDRVNEEEAIDACEALSMALADTVVEKAPDEMPVELVVGSLIAVAMDLIETTSEDRTDDENGVALLQLVTDWLKACGYGGALRPDRLC